MQHHPIYRELFAHTHTYLLGDLVHLSVEEAEVGIEMVVLEESLASHTMRHLSLQVHHELQHFVVRLARKHYLTGVQFEQSTANRPHINGIVVLATHNCKHNKQGKEKEGEE